MILQSSKLPQNLRYIPANDISQDFDRLNHSFRIDKKSPPGMYVFLFIKEAVGRADRSAGVRQHGKSYATADQGGKRCFVPASMGIDAVDAYGEHLGVQLLEGRVFDGNCRHFGRSDTAEICRIEEEQNPHSAIVGKPDESCLTLVECFTGKIRGVRTNVNTHMLLLATIPVTLWAALCSVQNILRAFDVYVHELTRVDVQSLARKAIDNLYDPGIDSFGALTG